MWALESLGPLAMLGGPSVGRDLPPVKSVSHHEERWVVDSEPGMGRVCSESPQAWLSQTVAPSERGEEWGRWAAGAGEAPLCSQTEDSPPKILGTQSASFSVTHHAQYPASFFHSSGVDTESDMCHDCQGKSHIQAGQRRQSLMEGHP